MKLYQSEEVAFRDSGAEPDVPSMLVNGYALGVTSLVRLKRIVADLGEQACFNDAEELLFADLLHAISKRSDRFFDEVVWILATDGRVHVRTDLASYLSLAKHRAWSLLARDMSACVRAAVAGNPRVSKKWLDALSRDEDEIVRYRVAENNKTSEATAAHLAESDASPFVRKAAQKRLADA